MKNTNKIVLLVFNILIAALSVMAIVGYIVMPFWTVSVGVKFTDKTKEAIMQLVDESLNSDKSGSSAYVGGSVSGAPYLMSVSASESGIGSSENSDKRDKEDEKKMTRAIIEALLDNFAADKVDISVPIKFSTSAIFGSLTASDTAPVDKLIKSAVKESLDEKNLDKIVTQVTKSTAKAMVDVIPTLLTAEQAEEFEDGMAYIGLDEKYVKEQVEVLVEALTSGKNTKNGKNETLTKDGFTEDYIIPIIEDITVKAATSQYATEQKQKDPDFDIKSDVNEAIFDMRETNRESDFNKANKDSSGTYKKAEYSNENYFVGDKINDEGRRIIKKFLKEQAFDQIWKDTDNIKLDSDALKKLIQEVITENDSGGSSQSTVVGYRSVSVTFAVGGLMAVTSASESATDSESTAASEDGDITDELADKLTSQIDEETKAVIMTVLKVLAGILIFSILVWVYQLVKVIVNTLTGKMRTKMKLSIWCGWYPYMFFALIPNLALFALKQGWIPIEASAVNAINILKLTFNSSGMLAFIAAMAFIVIWIPYKIIYKKYKQEA